MLRLELKKFLMQFSKLILVNNKKNKKDCLNFFFPWVIACIRRIFLSYHLPEKSPASTEDKHQKHEIAKL